MRLLLLTVSAGWLVACSSTPPITVTCKDNETACGTVCALLKTDDANCGSCSKACGAGAACANGACYPTSCGSAVCDPSSVCFESRCQDKACVGVVCPANQVCSQGGCVCGPGKLTCGGQCVDPKVDDANCGACGAVCGASESCGGGACHPDDCAGADCDPLSVCFQAQCVERACVGVVCPAGQACRGGTCGCAAGEETCSGRCVDTTADDANCGACGRACAATESCAAGVCYPDDCAGDDCDPASVCYRAQCTERACVGVSCPQSLQCQSGRCGCAPGATVCNSLCVNPKLDDANCGRCGSACTSTTRCAAGACLPKDCPSQSCDPLSVCFQGSCAEAACVGVVCAGGQLCRSGVCACPQGQTLCEGTCVDPQSSSAHCGRCGRACSSTEACLSGACQSNTCAGGQTPCGTACTDTRTDPNNCGGCGVACGGGRNCVGSSCTCPPGLTLCGTACVNTGTDAVNCGMCGRSCGAGACAGGQCQCPIGQTLCAGRCVNSATDAMNCGMCGRTCTTAQVCSGGACVCPPGQTFCNGQCINTSNDNLNCGGCGSVCQSGRFCVGSNCVTPFTCQTNFSMPPMDCPLFPVDPTLCGVAGTAPVSTVGPLTGSLAANGSTFDVPVTLGPADFVRATAFLTVQSNSTSCRFSLYADAGVELQAASDAVFSTSSVTLVQSAYGSAVECGQPMNVRLAKLGGATLNYTVNVERFATNGRFNVGGTSLGNATPLATVSGRACEQVCGMVHSACASRRQTFSLTLPAGKAAIINFAVRGPSSSGTVFAVRAFQPSGVLMCEPVRSTIGFPSWSVETARLVNNTPQAQPVILEVDNSNTASTQSFFQLAVAVEP